jgi:hypothetical protein
MNPSVARDGEKLGPRQVFDNPRHAAADVDLDSQFFPMAWE